MKSLTSSGVLNRQPYLLRFARMDDYNYGKILSNGRDLEKKNMLDPIAIVRGSNPEEKPAPKTMVRFCRGAPVLVTGDITGNINVYRLNRDEDNLDNSYQTDKLQKLVYPNGYKLGNAVEEPQNEEKE